jgi:group I intron endonuclease
MASGIYAIINAVNEKRYVGSTSDFKKRRREHWNALAGGYHENQHLQRSANRHGLGAFRFEILEEASAADLKVREQFHLDRLNPEYNMCPASDSTLGIRRSDETKARMSKAAERSNWMRGRKSDQHPFHGQVHSLAARAKMRANKHGRVAWNAGLRTPASVRAKQSVAKRGKPTWNKGKQLSASHRANLRKAWERRKAGR